jgi:serine/threonine-protein kinase
MPLTSGETFAGYTILSLLGSGGMGEVYLAQHPRLPRREALKVLRIDLSANDEFRARFNREADLAATLYHPHIVGVHDRGEFQGRLWISMDYIDGTDAGRLIRDRYPAGMPASDAVAMVSPVADALDYAHERGVLHRDVKSANILLTDPQSPRQRVLLGDFGIARDLSESSRLTQTNMAVGTLLYTAPEQLMDMVVDGRADQYGLAVTAYELLTGSTPFEHVNPAVVITQHLNSQPRLLATSRPELTGLDPVFAVALAKDPNHRFRTCGEFSSALVSSADQRHAIVDPAANTMRAVARPNPSTAVLPAAAYPADQNLTAERIGPSQPQQRRSWLVGALIVLLFVLAVLFAMRPWQHDRESHPSTQTSASPLPSPSKAPITFESMRDFVAGYYGQLPVHAEDAWAKLDSHYQQQTGLSDYLKFWSTVRSLVLLSVTPRDSTSVVARLQYVDLNGQSSTEDRWLRVVVADGTMLIADSQRIGSA